MMGVAFVLVPAIVAGAIWAAAGRMYERRPAAPRGLWAGGLAIGLGFCAGLWVLAGYPDWPPKQANGRLFYAVLAVALIAIGGPWWGKHWARWPLWAGLSGAAAYAQFYRLFASTWSTGEGAAWLLLIAVGTVALAYTIDATSEKRPGAGVPLALWLASAAASAGLVFGASALLGQWIAAMAGIMGAAFVLALWHKPFTLHGGAGTVFAVAYTGAIWQGQFYADLSVWPALLLWAAPLALWLGEAPAIAKRGVAAQYATRLAGVAVIAGVGVGIAYAAYRAAADSPASYY